MVFDDSEELLVLRKGILIHAGYEASTELFGTDEVLRIKITNPDLVVLDCSVGQMAKGWQIIQILRLTPDTALLPVVFCVAAKRMDDLKGYLNRKRVVLLPKPYDSNDLLLSIERAFTFSQIPKDPHTKT